MSPHSPKTTPFFIVQTAYDKMRGHLHKLPHYTRLFSASSSKFIIHIFKNGVVWLALLLVVVVNVYLVYGENVFRRMTDKHLFLQKETATTDNQTILGVSDAKKQTRGQEATILGEYEFWKTTITDHPDYRDAYIQAVIRAYQLGKISEAKEYLQKAKLLDPNNQEISRLESLLLKQ